MEVNLDRLHRRSQLCTQSIVLRDTHTKHVNVVTATILGSGNHGAWIDSQRWRGTGGRLCIPRAGGDVININQVHLSLYSQSVVL